MSRYHTAVRKAAVASVKAQGMVTTLDMGRYPQQTVLNSFILHGLCSSSIRAVWFLIITNVCSGEKGMRTLNEAGARLLCAIHLII